MADNDVSKGDEVTWKTHGTTTHGTVEKEITSDTEAAGRRSCQQAGAAVPGAQ